MEKRKFFDKSDVRFVVWNIVGAVLVGFGLIACLVLWLRSYTQHGVEVEVTDVRGLVVAEAEPLLSAQGLHIVIIDSTYSDKVPFGTIVDQDPKPASHAKHGRAVYVTVNASTKRQVIMPNLQDMSSRQAETTLRSLGLQVDSKYEYIPSAFRDLVLDVKADEKSVQPGEKIAVGTKVRLVVGYGKGNTEVKVPNVVGLTIRDARSLLMSHRLTMGVIYRDEQEEEGVEQYIYRQNPDAGQKVLEGEAITIHASKDIEKVATGGGSTSTQEEDGWF